jgi:hypothetical protein
VGRGLIAIINGTGTSERAEAVRAGVSDHSPYPY